MSANLPFQPNPALPASGSPAAEEPQLPGERPTGPPQREMPPSLANTPPAGKSSESPPTQPAAKPTSSIRLLKSTELLALIPKLVKEGVSDVHLRVGHPPRARLHGQMMTLQNQPYVSDKCLFDFLQETIPFRALGQVDSHKEIDYAFDLDGIARFRVNLFYEMGRPGMVLRVIPTNIPLLETLGLPDLIDQFCHLHSGLVLITGPTGSGKTTALAAMLNRINLTYAKHIVTVEDPIEFCHPHQKCVVTQRELGSDTDTFATGVKYALRQDPDVILIGEMRDADTIRNALIAAETGHLVFSTLHTTDAVQTINRVINAFEPHHREPIRTQLAEVLKGTIALRLVPHVSGQKRVPIVEVMKATPTVTDYIKRNQVDAIYDLLNQTELGEMVSLNRSLYEAAHRGDISYESAIEQSNNPVALSRKLRGVFQGTN